MKSNTSTVQLNGKQKTNKTMTKEEKELLLQLLKKADESGLLHIYDKEENTYEIDWLFLDSEICIKIKIE